MVSGTVGCSRVPPGYRRVPSVAFPFSLAVGADTRPPARLPGDTLLPPDIGGAAGASHQAEVLRVGMNVGRGSGTLASASFHVCCPREKRLPHRERVRHLRILPMLVLEEASRTFPAKGSCWVLGLARKGPPGMCGTPGLDSVQDSCVGHGCFLSHQPEHMLSCRVIKELEVWWGRPCTACPPSPGREILVRGQKTKAYLLSVSSSDAGCDLTWSALRALFAMLLAINNS